MTDIPRCDFHIHTKYLGCANGTMEIPAIAREAERLGVKVLGITDHLNSLDKLELHGPIRKDIEELDTSISVYFGVELNFLGADGDFAYSAEVKEQYGFQFAIGGIHGTYLEEYDLKKIVEVQHRHHLKTCRDPLVDVLVHPYWFGKGEFDKKGWPWFDSLQAVPESYARELGQTAKETGTAIEINACANLENPAYSDRYVQEYIAFLAVVAEEGACFSLGSDAHDIGRLKNIQTAWQVAQQLRLTADRIWMPQGRPMKGGANI
jgi:histidinol phosphatase-like PHP family hydrolase